jgi:hypothetical protein
VLPANVGAGAGRINIQRGNVNLLAEYTYKANDPSFNNSYIYKNGEALIINVGYTKPGFGLSLSGKRIDNMSFRLTARPR